MAEISIERVSKRFGATVTAVDAVSLTVDEGEFVVLVGPSGCGKSTLLRMIAGLEELSEGTIRIGGDDVTHMPPRDRDVAMVFQNYALYPHLTVRANLSYGLKVRRAPKDVMHRQVDEVAALLHLEELLDRKPAQLSGGQRQRVAMGRAIVREPRAFLMDEPLSNLDAKLRVAMRASLSELHERLGITTIYVTHDQIEAMTLGQRVAVLSQGRLQQVDRPHLLYRRPANLFVATFLGSPAMNVVNARVSDGHVTFGDLRLPLDPQQARPPSDIPLVVGIRPEHIEDAAFAPPGLPTFEVDVAVLEDTGADAHVIFPVRAPAVDLRPFHGAPDHDEDDELVEHAQARFTGRIHPATSARPGQRLRVAVDPSQLYFFDATTGASLVHPVAAISAFDVRPQRSAHA